MARSNELFRSEAVQKLRDPQQLDSVITLTTPRTWLILLSFGLIISGFTVWGFVGSLPLKVHGLGTFLMSGSSVFVVKAPGGGEVAEINISEGDQVAAGSRVVVLKSPELRERVATAERELAQIRAQRELQAEYMERDVLQRASNTLAQIQVQEGKIFTLGERLDYLRQLAEINRDELSRKYITRDVLEKTLDQIADTDQEISSARVDIAKLETAQSEYENEQLQKLEDLDAEILRAESSLIEVRTKADTEQVVYSPAAGVVTEIDINIGVHVESGQQLLTIEQHGKGLTMYAYVPVTKGKKVQLGMKAQVAPTFVERDLYGSILGKVIRISDLPVDPALLQKRFGNEEVVKSLIGGGPPLEIHIELEKDPSTESGFLWTSSKGPPVQITAGSGASISIITREMHPVDLIVPIAETWTN